MDKQTEIKRFIIQDRQFVMSATAKYITEKQICNAIAENNESYTIYHDYVSMGLMVKCKNKPRDLLVYGLSWEAK